MTTFIENEYGFTEILKHVNDLSEKMNLKQVLEAAESIYHQIINSKRLPDRVRVILGMEAVNAYGDEPASEDEEEVQKIKRQMELKEEDEEQLRFESSCDAGLEQNYF